MKTTTQDQTTSNRELQAVVLPDGLPALEWADAEAQIPEAARRLQDEVYDRFVTGGEGEWLLPLAFSDGGPRLHASLEFFRDVAVRFGRKIARTPDLEEIREAVEAPFPADERREALDRVPDMAGAEYISDAFLRDLWDRLHRAFVDAVQAFDGSMEAFIQGFNPDRHVAGRVYFHLVENPRGPRPFAFLATYSTRLDSDGKSRHIPLKHALQEYGQEELLELLSTVYRAAGQSQLVADLVETGELFHPLSWDSGEAHRFLREIPIYEAAGILCRIPDWWRAGAASVRLNITLGDTAPSQVGMNALVEFDPRLYIGDEPITAEEARELLSSSEGLALIKNRWVAVDPDKLSQTLDAYDKVQDLMEQGFTLREAMRMQLQPERFLKDGIDPDAVSVSTGDWLGSVMEKLRDPSQISNEPPEHGKGFQADLRPYQERGVHWLSFLHSLGFGACLADDMGLGKTVQLLAFLSIVKASKAGPGQPADPSGVADFQLDPGDRAVLSRPAVFRGPSRRSTHGKKGPGPGRKGPGPAGPGHHHLRPVPAVQMARRLPLALRDPGRGPGHQESGNQADPGRERACPPSTASPSPARPSKTGWETSGPCSTSSTPASWGTRPNSSGSPNP